MNKRAIKSRVLVILTGLLAVIPLGIGWVSARGPNCALQADFLLGLSDLAGWVGLESGSRSLKEKEFCIRRNVKKITVYSNSDAEAGVAFDALLRVAPSLEKTQHFTSSDGRQVLVAYVPREAYRAIMDEIEQSSYSKGASKESVPKIKR